MIKTTIHVQFIADERMDEDTVYKDVLSYSFGQQWLIIIQPIGETRINLSRVLAFFVVTENE